ncbi:MAG: 2-C-methyl-D-erythritol 2,4-cyclodiphosphate synthase [Enterobacterales bacterium]|nr:2-C-methyl-D-erythritol 2,4-cyclodiphosphate synthase [Enterobacterales bacterium]
MRVGHGFDAHKFSEEGDLILGGVNIATAPKLEAHSDGDVLIHALCDAILGALGKGDIGKHFPDTDDEYSNIDSRILLRHVVALMQQQDYTIGNCDITVIAQKPKLASYLPAMCDILSQDLQISTEQINIKATTTEKMGYIGRGEGISVHSVVLLINA